MCPMEQAVGPGLNLHPGLQLSRLEWSPQGGRGRLCVKAPSPRHQTLTWGHGLCFSRALVMKEFPSPVLSLPWRCQGRGVQGRGGQPFPSLGGFSDRSGTRVCESGPCISAWTGPCWEELLIAEAFSFLGCLVADSASGIG